MKRGVILVAGGQGVRMGGDLPKQFIPVHGKPVLMHTLGVFHRWDESAMLVVVLPEAHRAYWEMLCRELDCRIPHRIATGGETRFHSVRNALPYVSQCDVVGVHDGVRPLVTPEVIESCFVEAATCGAAVPVIPLTESIRVRDDRGSRAVDRADYCIVQTPQVFHRDRIEAAYRQPYNPLFTDDASVVEASGKSVCLVSGNRENIKITTPTDLVIAEKMLAD
ncbi:MAG: 2-C-methyl-D-erythritol 4-phosphate cytidylyltransferase [Tannerella sp.]|jgi:2-C-methyl-D-erythritol 4-phosphate cytidylyltransferase|nr:2-C-methyl-D-erythritol 4-phosphate cytidylyltransferase [Tannerella sp.]